MNSASQIGTARDCMRKWAFSRIAPVQNPELEKAAARGHIVHGIGQAYHDKGKAPSLDEPLGRAFAQALPFVPKPGAGRAEGEFSLRVSGSEYMGFIDLQCMATDLPGIGPELAGVPAVIDYKSKATIRQGDRANCMQGPGDFLDDPQALVYAVKVLVQTGADRVLLRWIYLQCEGKPKAYCSDAVVSREDVTKAFGRIVHPIAITLDEVRVRLHLPTFDALTLTPNPATCRKYGAKWACPYESRCNITASDELAALDDTGENDMDLLAKLQSKTGATTQAAAPAPAPEAPKGINPPKPQAQAKAETPTPTPTACKAPCDGDAELGRALRVILKAWAAESK